MKFLNNTLYALGILLVVSIAGLFVASMLPIPGSVEMKIVKSGSMEPAIPVGSIIVAKPISEYKVGDVITFGADTATQIPTTHRIIGIREEQGSTFYTVKGDANEEADPKEVNRREIIGKVVFSLPYVGYILDFAKQPIGFSLLIGLPAAIIILDELFVIVAELRRKWRPKKTDRGGKGNSGGSDFDTDVETTRSRRSVMDDIYVQKRVYRARPDIVLPRHRYVNAMCGLFILSAVLAHSFGGFGGTISYFRDTETSIGNIFNAGLLDFLVADNTIARTITATTTPLIIPVMTPEPGSFPTLYKVTAEQTGGSAPLCNALNLLATTTPFIYSGPLISISTVATTTTGFWQFGLTLSTTTGFSNGAVCNADLIYRGWHPNAPEYTGFTDEERVHLVITYEATASVFDIVLNEFLPNPDPSAGGLNFGEDNDSKPLGEWIELYNKGDIAQDIAGWFMTDASGGVGNTHAVISTTTTNTGLTIIPAHGWLVVFMNKPSLNNTGDEIFLYTPGAVEVDFVSYNDPSSACENDPTQGTGNVGTGITGTPGNGPNADCVANQVAPNKSYARIPDGTGAWVDPIPTPGTFNVLEEAPVVAQKEVIQETASASTTSEEVAPIIYGGGGMPVDAPPVAPEETNEIEETSSSTPETALDSDENYEDSSENTSENTGGGADGGEGAETNQEEPQDGLQGESEGLDEGFASAEPGPTPSDTESPAIMEEEPAVEEVPPEPEPPPSTPDPEPTIAETAEAPATEPALPQSDL